MYIPKEDAASPMAHLESVMLTALIDAEEGQDVAIADIPNTFVQMQLEDDNDKVIMHLCRPLATLLCELAPEV